MPLRGADARLAFFAFLHLIFNARSSSDENAEFLASFFLRDLLL